MESTLRRCRSHLAAVSACLALGGCAVLSPEESTSGADRGNASEDVSGGSESAAGYADEVALSQPGDKADEVVGARFVPPEVESLPGDIWSRLARDFSLPDVANRRIDEEIARYAGRQRYFEIVARRARPYLHYIVGRIEDRGLPAELLLIPVVESAFRPFAYSYARAGGIWQFKPLTGRRFGLEQNWWYDGRRDVLASTDAALDYLEYLHGFFDGDWLLAIAAYNGGEGTVQRAIRRNRARGEPTDYWHLDLPAQTEKYVPRILALREILSHPGVHGIELPAMPEDESLRVVEVEGQVDLALAAEMAGIPLETLYRYNSGFNRWATPPDGPHRLAVPANKADALRTALAEHDREDMIRWQRHEVASGDTLSAIAERYDTTIGALREANDLAGSMIRAGQYLLVPTASRAEGAYALSLENRRDRTQASGPGGRERIDYRVRRGDTFWGIARAHDVEVRKLAAWNDMAPGDPLRPGQQLAIWIEGERAGRGGPGGRVQQVEYTVRDGDSLHAIARRFNVEVAQIRRWNDLRAGEYLHPGQRLELRVDVTEQAEAG